MADLFERIVRLRSELGEEELEAALARLEAGEQHDFAQNVPKRAHRASDGAGYGEPKRRRKRGVDGWTQRVQIAGSRRVFWARTKAELRDAISDAQLGNAKLSRRGAKQPPATPGEARERFLRAYPDGASKRALEDRLSVILDTPLLEMSGRTLAELAYGSWDDEELSLLVQQLAAQPRRRTGRPYSASSIRGHLKAFRQLSTWMETRYGEQNWARLVQLPDATKSADPLENWDEVFALAAAFQELGYPDYGRLVRFACGCGPRPEEWLVARECDLDRKLGTFTFRRALVETSRGVWQEVKTLKTASATATIILPEVALDAIREIPEAAHRDPRDWQRSPLLWPDWRYGDRPIDLQAFRRKQYETSRTRRDGTRVVKQPGPWTEAFELAGLRRRPPSQMRHTFAYLALQAGVPREDVALMLRHKDGDTTMVEQHYAHLVPAMARRSIERLNAEAPRYGASKTHSL